MTEVADRPLFIVATPYPASPQVTLFQSRWENHIIANHVGMQGKETTVEAIVSRPTIVLPGSPDHPAHYVMFVSQTLTPSGRTPIGVIVDQQLGTIVTAYPNRSLKFIDSRRALWLP